MTDPKKALALLNLLAECETTPLHRQFGQKITYTVTPAEPPAEPPAALPKPLEQFLTEYIAHPEWAAEANLVMSSAMQEFGTRIFCQLLSVGLGRKECDTDLDRNQQDLADAHELLVQLSFECSDTPFLPPSVAELLARVANALGDILVNNSQPPLFDLPAIPRRLGTAGQQCEGRLAAALDIVIKGGMKPAAAKAWLEAEMRAAKIVDEAGNPIPGKRVASWRNNFNKKGIGAAHARLWFDKEIEVWALQEAAQRRGWRGGALLHAPNDGGKIAACQKYARRSLRLLAFLANRTVPRPVKR